MRQAFVFEKVAVIVGPWHEPMRPPERGARVEVRLLQPEPRRGSRSAAERVVIDQPVFRADLFDQTNAPPGNLRSAHFHPSFVGVEPSDRHWDDAIQHDPTAWLRRQLGDLGALLERSGLGDEQVAEVSVDAPAVRDAAPAIVAAVEAAWATARADDAPAGLPAEAH